MKNLALFTIVLLSVSCGKIEVTGEAGATRLGQSRSVNAVFAINDLDRDNFTKVCDALTQKAAILPNLVSNSTFVFTTNQSDCDGKNYTEPNVETVIQSNGSNFSFKQKVNGLDFIYPEVETNTSGIMSSICNNLNSYQNPNINGSEAVYINSNGISGEDCPVVGDEVCVQVEKGIRQGEFFIIHTLEWVRFKISSPTNSKIGFYTHRKRLTRGHCGIDKALTSKAELKN